MYYSLMCSTEIMRYKYKIAMGIFIKIIPHVFKFSYLLVSLIISITKFKISNIKFITIATKMNLNPTISGIKVLPK